MEQEIKCPACHIAVRSSDYYCFNCGKNLKPAPLSITVQKQTIVYLESLFLPPYGIILGIRYLREKNKKAKVVGIIAIILTIISIVISIKLVRDLIDTINTQVNSQMNSFMGF